MALTKVYDARIRSLIKVGKSVLIVAKNDVDLRYLRDSVYYSMRVDVTAPFCNVVGRRYDVIIYRIPRFSSVEDVIKYSEWVQTACKPTLNPSGFEADFTDRH